MARSTGAAPRHRGSSEKWTLSIGTTASTWGRISFPNATTTPSRAPTSTTSSTRSVTERPRSSAAAFTGLGTSVPPRPRFRSGCETTSATSWPSSTSIRSGWTATSGVPRKARRTRRLPLQAVGARRRPAPAELGIAVAQLAQRLLALVGIEALEQQDAVEVVDLVLEQPGEHLVAFDRELVPVEVEAGDVHLLRPHDLEREPRHRQAALLVEPFAPRLCDRRVHDHVGPGVVLEVVDEEPLLHAHLGRRQPEPRRVVHRHEHVRGETGEHAVDVVDLGRPLAEDRVAEDADHMGHAVRLSARLPVPARRDGRTQAGTAPRAASA